LQAVQQLKRLTQKVWQSCEAKGSRGRTVTVKVKYNDFQQVTRSRTNGEALTGGNDLIDLAATLLDGVFPFSKGIRLLGVTVSGFQPIPPEREELQLRLID